jgi:hypothetical protein
MHTLCRIAASDDCRIKLSRDSEVRMVENKRSICADRDRSRRYQIADAGSS